MPSLGPRLGVGKEAAGCGAEACGRGGAEGAGEDHMGIVAAAEEAGEAVAAVVAVVCCGTVPSVAVENDDGAGAAEQLFFIRVRSGGILQSILGICAAEVGSGDDSRRTVFCGEVR